MSFLSNMQGYNLFNQFLSYGTEAIKRECVTEKRYNEFCEGKDLLLSSLGQIQKIVQITEEQKTPEHILISIFTCGIFAIIKEIQRACLINSCAKNLKLAVKKLDSAIFTGTFLEGMGVKLLNPMIDELRRM